MESEKRWIKGYEDMYKIDTEGNIWSYRRPNVKQLSLQNDFMYNYVNFTVQGVRELHLVHELVAYTFIPNPHNYDAIVHLNGIVTDNRVENLAWCKRRISIPQWTTRCRVHLDTNFDNENSKIGFLLGVIQNLLYNLSDENLHYISGIPVSKYKEEGK